MEKELLIAGITLLNWASWFALLWVALTSEHVVIGVLALAINSGLTLWLVKEISFRIAYRAVWRALGELQIDEMIEEAAKKLEEKGKKK